MASEPNIQQIIENAVSQAVEQTKAALAESISESLASLTAELTKHQEHARRIDSKLEERVAGHIRGIDGAVVAVEQRISGAVAGLGESIDARIAEYHSAAETARDAVVEAARVAETVVAATEEAKLRTAEADRAEAAARERVSQAEAVEARAKRAVALATQRADLMVEQAVEERRAKLRRKALLSELDQAEADLADRFDAQNEFIDREMDEHYASIRERLGAALSGEMDAELQEGENVGDVQAQQDSE